ncbi:hypothetical protein BR93DRAFT_461036 [Coniochaeta sp. PMI_546]|nr:hypothetical protein BR93DRAFT_461036 [Coniochaeta sp. PMI_546]
MFKYMWEYHWWRFGFVFPFVGGIKSSAFLFPPLADQEWPSRQHCIWLSRPPSMSNITYYITHETFGNTSALVI